MCDSAAWARPATTNPQTADALSRLDARSVQRPKLNQFTFTKSAGWPLLKVR